MLGGPTAAVIAYQNPFKRVTVVDCDERRIRRWNSKHLPIYEPDLAGIVRIARDGVREYTVTKQPKMYGTSDFTSEKAMHSSENGISHNACLRRPTVVPARDPNLIFSTDFIKCISEADMIIIAVNTPTKLRGSGAGSATDMTAFEAAMGFVARYSRPGAIIVEKSTVPCRTAQFIEEIVRFDIV